MPLITCNGCGHEFRRGPVACPRCDRIPGRTDAPADLTDPSYCTDCGSWHESDDRPSWRDRRGHKHSKCPLCGGRGVDVPISEPLYTLRPSTDDDVDVGESGQSTFSAFDSGGVQ